MSNIYTREDGLKVMEIEYGWGMDMEAIEFPVELAISRWVLIMKYLSLDKEHQVSAMSVLSQLIDVIENAKNGEITYILKDMWSEIMSNLKIIEKKYNKLKNTIDKNIQK